MASPQRFNAFDDGGQVQRRPLQRIDTWGPMDDSTGRGVHPCIDPLANPDDGSISLQEYRVGSIPRQEQCEEVLKRWFMWHVLDIEQAQDNVWASISCNANNRSVDETKNLAQWLNSLPEEEVVDF